MLFSLGVRYMTLTHNSNVGWADSATDVADTGGLSDFGRSVVAEMNRLGMLVDLSHVSADTMHAALDATDRPGDLLPLERPRGLRQPAQRARRRAARGWRSTAACAWSPSCRSSSRRSAPTGSPACGPRSPPAAHDPANLSAVFAVLPSWEQDHPMPPATIAQVADHIDHVRAVAGVDHVGIGGDFDGTPVTPVGLHDVSRYPALFAELQRRRWSNPTWQPAGATSSASSAPPARTTPRPATRADSHSVQL